MIKAFREEIKMFQEIEGFNPVQGPFLKKCWERSNENENTSQRNGKMTASFEEDSRIHFPPHIHASKNYYDMRIL